jgi:PAS domain S-box-containing protein
VSGGNEDAPDGALLGAELLDAPAMDRLARVATRALRAAIALLVVPVETRLAVAGRAGLPVSSESEVPQGSYCHRVVALGVCVDPDALRGTWEATELGARAALGFPVRVADGPVLGALVILDLHARSWSADEIEAAGEVAELVSAELDRRLAHARLRDAERYQAVLERSPEAILVHTDGTIRFANAAAVALLGGSVVADVVGQSIGTFLPSPYLKHVADRLVQPLEGPPLPLTEERLTRLDGGVRCVELATVAYLRGECLAVQMFLRDVTDRQVARDALRARETHLRLLVDRIPALYWTTDTELRMELSAGGVTPSTPRPRTTVQDFFSKGEGCVPVTTHRAALAGESASGILNWRDGEYEVRVEPLLDDAGRVVGTVGIAMDTTVRRRAETREREVREMEALGRVSGGVAHGVNNALATIAGVASVMLADPLLTAPGRRNLMAILDASGRAHALTSNLLGFSRQGRYRPVRLDLNAAASEAAEWTRLHQPALVVELCADLPVVDCDPDQVRQALINVCQNAIDATRLGGTIQIRTRRERVEASAGRPPHLAPGPYACVEVRDTGSGMADDVKARAIEPFYTTKELGAGAGLGLSMAFGVMRHHGGDLQITSAPGAGTSVTLYFPASEASPALLVPPSTPPVSAPRAPASNVVLLVDDDEWVVYSSRLILESLGYDVVTAMNGATALELFASAVGRFAFVLLDLRMPGMDGEEVLERLLVLDPGVRVILCTGFERDQVSQRIFSLGHVGFLGKPFGADDVLEQIRAMNIQIR